MKKKVLVSLLVLCLSSVLLVVFSQHVQIVESGTILRSDTITVGQAKAHSNFSSAKKNGN